jgi:allophanate hydrolase subunit 2
VEAFLSAAWKVTPQNDRMGYRLEGPRLAHLGGADILTDPLIPGAVQVPGSGQPIVLAVDCQTAGGYAKIATVIGPDLRLLAQARAGDEIRFARCTQAAAVRALREERATLSALARRIARGARGGRPWSST